MVRDENGHLPIVLIADACAEECKGGADKMLHGNLLLHGY